MKRTAIIFLLMLSAATAAQAQNNLFDILKGAASAAVDKATDGAYKKLDSEGKKNGNTPDPQ